MTGKNRRHDYPSEILQILQENGATSYRHGVSKDFVIKKIPGGDRNQIGEEIQKFIDNDILDYKNRKLYFKQDLQRGLKDLDNTLKNFQEAVFTNIFPRIEKNLKTKTTKPIFYTEPLKIQGKVMDPNFQKVNETVKSDLFNIIYYINSLIRASYSLFSIQLLYHLPEKQKKVFERKQREALEAIKKTRKKILKLTPSKYEGIFRYWWFQSTVGLTLDQSKSGTVNPFDEISYPS